MFNEQGQQFRFASGQFAVFSASEAGKEQCPLVGMALDGCYCGKTGSQTVQATMHYCGGDYTECAIYREMMKGKGHILIIDDEPDFRAGIARVLEKAGYKTSEAGDGEEAYKLLDDGKQRKQYDLLLVDVRMPGGSGIELVERIRRAGVALPMIAVSDCAGKGLIAELLHKGCSDFLYKPFEPKELVKRVGNLLGSSKSEGWDNGKG